MIVPWTAYCSTLTANDKLRDRLVYDSAKNKGASDAEGDCAVDKDDPDAENDSAMG